MPKSMPNRKRLTDLAVGRIGPGPITWDTLLPCFGIRPGTRTKTWIVNDQGSKHKVGKFPAMSTAEARTKAREMLEGGAKPLAGERLFKTLVEEFLQHACTRKGRPWRDNTTIQYRRNLALYGAPLRERPFAEINRRDVAALLRDVANTSGATTAALTRGMLHRLWSFAVSTGVVEHNIVTGTPSYEVPKRSRVLTDSEIAALWRATEEPADFHLIVRLCLWCGVRRSEAGGMRWSELVDGEWRIPGERCKNNTALTLPLPRQAAAALDGWPRIVGRDLLFGAHSRVGFRSWGKAKMRLDEKLGWDKPWTIHDLRRTTETRLAKLGVSKDLRGRILNHGIDPISQSYDQHHYLPEKQKALQDWADKLEDIVTSAEPAVIKLVRT